MPSKSELKALRKQWRTLEKSMNTKIKHLQDIHPLFNEEREEFDKQWISLDAWKKDMFEIGKVLLEHDTPFIQRKVSNWMWLHSLKID
jgi:hypothetical protein